MAFNANGYPEPGTKLLQNAMISNGITECRGSITRDYF